jgi:hypothetical protein
MSSPVFLVNGVDLAAFPNFTQESTAFVSILLPNNRRIFHWFEATENASAIYGKVQRQVGSNHFTLIDRDISHPNDCVVSPDLPITKALRLIHPGSTRNRFRLEVLLND